MPLPRSIALPNRRPKDVRIVNCAFRRRPPVAQGGPAGVQRLVEDIFGGIYRGFHMYYFYETPTEDSSELRQTSRILELAPMVTKNLRAYESLMAALPKKFNNKYFETCFAEGKIYYLVCHEVGSALAAHQMGFPYSIVYHQQGALAFELEAAGERLSETDRALLNQIERVAFTHADAVYFPSRGAQEIFFETSQAVTHDEVKLASRPLYNTVAEFEARPDLAATYLVANGFGKLVLGEARQGYRVLISVGDYNASKGMERVFDFACALQRNLRQKVLWISIGRENRSGIFADIQKRADGAEIETLLVGDRLPHDLVMSLIDFSDQFVMLQRRSIFDFSTLEAMSQGKSIVLSPVGGNPEFDTMSNILFFDPDAPPELQKTQLKTIAAADVVTNGRLNKAAFDRSFSRVSFEQGYCGLYNDILQTQLNPQSKPGLPSATARRAKEVFAGKDVLIVGPGGSSRHLTPADAEGRVLIALNSALNMELPFDVHFMQDEPAKVGSWNAYRQKDVDRFYGVVNNAGGQHLRIDFELAEKLSDKIWRYELAPIRFDRRFDRFTLDFDTEPVADMQSILFSAVQVCAWAEAKSIRLAGIDFSGDNYDGANPNKYASGVNGNLAFLAETLKERGVDFGVFYTNSAFIKSLFDPEAVKVEDKKRTPFRVLQDYAKAEEYEEAVQYFSKNFKMEWMKEPKYAREAAQIYQGADRLHEAAYFYELFFELGGESAQCMKNLAQCRDKLGLKETGS
ncbi:MAG: hypothetical protein QNJ16_05945 [Rhodobacter sp.]|nr:hypothetical protein [Rhodobacter sp.]